MWEGCSGRRGGPAGQADRGPGTDQGYTAGWSQEALVPRNGGELGGWEWDCPRRGEGGGPGRRPSYSTLEDGIHFLSLECGKKRKRKGTRGGTEDQPGKKI